MCSRVLSFSPVFLAGFALAVASHASAQIAAKSPFMPPQSAAAAGPTAGAPLEYRGYMETSEGTLFRIYDPAKKASTWVKVNERNADFDVLAKQYDEAQKTLTIEYQGKTLTLAERVSKVVSSGAAASAMPPPVFTPAQTNVPPAVTQAVVLNPTPADEQRRLDAVAAEVARRRALREQASQQLNQRATPQITVPQPAQTQLTGQPQRNSQVVPQGPYQQQNAQNPRQTRVPQPGRVRQQ
ncbi:MAG: hypothetical protein ACREH8_13930 [Opitutaceae bacterium]